MKNDVLWRTIVEKTSHKLMTSAYLILTIVMGAVYVGSPPTASAQSGMTAPRCDRELQPDSYFEKYINTLDFKATHPTYNQWQRLPDNDENSRVCINEDEHAVLFWSFTLPESLSKLQIQYQYKVALVVDWDTSAKIPHDLTPEELIVTAESLPEVNEFISKLSSELKLPTTIESSDYSESSGFISPLEIQYTTDNYERLTVSNAGVEWADLSVQRDWIHFPTMKISFDLAKQALKQINCSLNGSPTSVSRYSPHSRKNENEPEEFIYHSYTITCPDIAYRYSMVNIYPDGRFTVWLENRKQISSGTITPSDLANIQAVSVTSNTTLTTSKSVANPAAKNKQSSKEQTDFTGLKILVIVTFALGFLGSLVCLIINYLRRLKKSSLNNSNLQE